MFRQVVTSTPLTTDAANNFFQRIGGESFQRDVTFISTLRALVAPRIAEDESVYVRFTASNYSATRLAEYSAKNAVREVVYAGEDCNAGEIVVHSFCHTDQDSNYAWMELMKSTFTSVYPEWHLLDKFTDFYKKTFYTLCFINPTKKSVIIFVDNLSIQRMHYLQCAIFAFLPWYFDPAQGVSTLEMNLIGSLKLKDSAEYENCIAEIAEKYDFRAAKIRMLLAGFETRYEKLECDTIRNTIQRIMREIENLNQNIGQYLREKSDCEIKLLGLETKIASDSEDSEIMDYFMRNQNLVLENVNGETMTFVVKAYLEYFSDDMAQRMIDNANSYIYKPNGRACNNLIPADDMKLLMKAIFIDQSIRIKVCAAYTFSMRGNVSAVSQYGYPPECRECTPNPHIDGFSCMGNYKQTINTLLQNHNYIAAIEQCAASCRSLNFGDSTVMSEFMKRIYGMSDRQSRVNMRCIELPNGSVVYPKEAIEWLKAQEATNE